MSLTCGGTADTIVEYRKVTSYGAFVARYEFSISCGVPIGAIGDYRKVTSYRALSQLRWHSWCDRGLSEGEGYRGLAQAAGLPQ